MALAFESRVVPGQRKARPRPQPLSAAQMAALFGLFAFAGSLLLAPFYTAGDQEAYKPLYEEIRDHPDWSSKFAFYFLSVGAIEPFYLLLVNSLAGWMPKDLAFSMLNGVLAGTVALWLLERKVALIIVSLLMFNAYLMVLFFSAERLKLALLLFTLAYSVGPRWRWLLFLLAVLSQFQTVLLVLTHLIWSIGRPQIQHRGLKLGLVLLAFALAMAGVLAVPVVSGYLSDKLGFYADSGWGGAMAVTKPLLFMGASLYYCRRQRLQVVAAFAPLIVASFFLGSERLALFSYFLFMVLVAPRRKGWNLATLATSLYFAYQGLEFIANFINHGQGLPDSE